MSFEPLVHYSFSASLILHRSSSPFILSLLSQLQNDLLDWWCLSSLPRLPYSSLLQFIYCRSTCSRVGWMTERDANFTIHFDGLGKTLKGPKYWTSEEEDITHKNLVLVGLHSSLDIARGKRSLQTDRKKHDIRKKIEYTRMYMDNLYMVLIKKTEYEKGKKDFLPLVSISFWNGSRSHLLVVES